MVTNKNNMSSAFLVTTCILLWVFAFIPLTTTAVFLIYGYNINSELDGWPVVYEDDIPTSLIWLDQIAGSMGAIFICSIPLAFLSALLLNSTHLKNTYIKCIFLYLSGIALMLLLLLISPLDTLVMWHLD